jgi:hypothetical protein
MSDDIFIKVLGNLESAISDHNQVYDEEDDTYYLKDDKCTCDYCVAFRVLFTFYIQATQSN